MKLFLSYARDDSAWVGELYRALRDKAHHDVWIDRRLVPAQDWWLTILEQIEACECFVYVLTPKSVESIYCRAEVDYALALNKPVLPLMLKPCDYPASLAHRRVQYKSITDEMSLIEALFYTSQGLNEVHIAILQGKYGATPTPRPDLPTPSADPDQVLEVYTLAADAVAQNNFPLAETFYQQVITADPQGYGVAAKQRLTAIRREQRRQREYLTIVRMAADPAQLNDARALALIHIKTFNIDHTQDEVLAALLTPMPPPRQPDPIQEPSTTPPAAWNRAALRRVLGNQLSLDELQAAAFDLNIEFEGLEKERLVRKLIQDLDNRGRLDQLVAWLQDNRPDIDPRPFLAEMPSNPPPPLPTPPRIETPTTTPKPTALTLGSRMTDDKGVSMVYVPPGAFMMGSTEYDDEKPPHEFTIARGFWLDLTPVTNAMYARFVKESGYTTREFWTPGGWDWVQGNKKTGPQDYEGFTQPD